MGTMRYKPLDKVRIKSLDWYEDNCNRYGVVECGDYEFFEPMNEYCGEIVTITRIDDCYRVNIDKGAFCWTDEMIEGLVEEEALKQYEVPTGSIKIWDLPNGYIFKDENGNVINATKIVLEKKKKKYPKTYEECEKTLGLEDSIIEGCLGCEYKLLNAFQKLLMCRDAYWKIAGEEMGLGKPWEPDYNEESYEQGCPIKYVIYYTGTNIIKGRKCTPSYVLSFPTEEMRDTFYENFKELINECKELL